MLSTTLPNTEMTGDLLTTHAVFIDHAPFVIRVVRRLGVAPADVEDVAQEVFVVVHKKLDTYDGSCLVRTWLFGIARRVVSDYRRRAHIRLEVASGSAPVLSVEPGQAQELGKRELSALLDRALDELDESRRAVFVLYEMEGMPMSEVAASLGCPLFTAYSRLREARGRLKTFIERNQLLGDLR